jgi:cell division protease FtsH
VLLIVLFLGMVAAGVLWNGGDGDSASKQQQTFSRSDSGTRLVADVKAGDVARLTYYDQQNEVVARYDGGRQVLVPVPVAYAPRLLQTAIDDHVEVVSGSGNPDLQTSAAAQSRYGESLPLVLVAVGILGLLATAGKLYGRRADRKEPSTAGGAHASAAPASSGGKAAHTHEDTETVADVPTRFSDVAGCEEAVADLREMVDYLKDPTRYTRLGAQPPRGALLTGPPGTGKTLLARAVAGEAGVAFLPASGSDFVEKYVGVGAQRIRDLFQRARKESRAIVFIDEIDAIGRHRSRDVANNSEGENTLIALLTELDGFKDRGDIIVLAATNRPDVLDAAVTRPGRLDRKVVVPTPDRRGREQILTVHVKDKPVAPGLDLRSLARRTPGFSGAQLAAVVNEACMVAARQDLTVVTPECFDAAVETVAMGRPRNSALVTEHDRRITAWHEAGHTVAAFLIPEANDPVSVSIIPRGPAGGVTWMTGSDDAFLSRRAAHAQLVVAMGGRVGEELLLDGEYTQGASNDLHAATQMATAMVAQYGMTSLGYAVHDSLGPSAEERAVVEDLLADAHERATKLLTEHHDFLMRVAGTLLDDETMALADITAIADALGVDRTDPVDLPGLPASRQSTWARAEG